MNAIRFIIFFLPKETIITYIGLSQAKNSCRQSRVRFNMETLALQTRSEKDGSA